MSTPSPSPLQGVPEHIRSLLARLHAESKAQEAQLSWDDFQNDRVDSLMKDKFIALDEDKAHFVYQTARAIGAKTIVEAGTSYGVSTIYLALAVAANVAAAGGQGRVIGTEHELAKAARAREYWRECGDAVSGVIDLREGDLRETLKENLENVDLLLLDSRPCHTPQKCPKCCRSILTLHLREQYGHRWRFQPLSWSSQRCVTVPW